MSESSSARYLGASIAIVAGTVAALRLIGITLIESYYEKHLSRLKQEASSRRLLHAKYKKGEVQAVDVVIIGAGMSGLSCAALLARCGHSVLVLEQHHDVCGGGTHMFELKG